MAGFTGYKFSDKQVVMWAQLFANSNYTLSDMEECLGVSHSTIWWCFQNRLLYLDITLYWMCLEKLNHHIHNHVHKKGAAND